MFLRVKKAETLRPNRVRNGFLTTRGGSSAKWYGNKDYLVNWKNDGRAIRAFGTENGGRARSRQQNTEFYFLPSVTWSFVSSSYFGVRYSDAGSRLRCLTRFVCVSIRARPSLGHGIALLLKQVYEFMHGS